MNKKQNRYCYHPDFNQNYYYIGASGDIKMGEWFDGPDDNFRLGQQNCYISKKEAMKHFENLKTKGELRLLAEKLNSDNIINWKDGGQPKVALAYLAHTQEFGVTTAIHAQEVGQIYCLSGNFLNEAKSQIGEERLIEMIKSGV